MGEGRGGQPLQGSPCSGDAPPTVLPLTLTPHPQTRNKRLRGASREYVKSFSRSSPCTASPSAALGLGGYPCERGTLIKGYLAHEKTPPPL